jgi:asparagine synthase (glutamine-hydrolysing)
MCGICGVVELDPRKDAATAGTERMVRALRHRGPDGCGVHAAGSAALGHTRLSIIDLSNAGQQPMPNEDGRYWIVFNGEIYNYVELREGLLAHHKFRSHTDTEVILHLYEQHGPACVERLNGMFSFAIWDTKERTLFASRDRLGIKPFYYSLTPTQFLFASEIKALVAHPIAVESNPPAIADYLTFQFCLGDKTLFRGVNKLLPGHSLMLRPGGPPQITKYWDPDYTTDVDHTDRYFQEQLTALLDDAIRLQLRADVPIGAHLSGGLDSTTVTCLASQRGNGSFHTFSGAFDDGRQFDESGYARLVAERSGTIHHEVRPTAAQFADLMPKLVFAMDEPAAGPGLFPQYLVSALARDHVKVVLGGQGGDEVFGGYTRYLILYLEACLKGGIEGTQEDDRYVVTFESILPNLRQLQGYEPLLRQFWSAGLFGDSDRRYYQLITRTGNTRELIHPEFWTAVHENYDPFESFRDEFNRPGCQSLINKMTRFDLGTLLPALLQVEDRTSMSVSLESRVPLLDHRIVELAASMPPRVKFSGGRSKHIFREVAQAIVPPEISGRTDKMGFPVPLNRWYREEPVRSFVGDALASAATSHQFVRPGVVERAHQGGADFDRGVWGLLNLELWMQAFVDAGPNHAD